MFPMVLGHANINFAAQATDHLGLSVCHSYRCLVISGTRIKLRSANVSTLMVPDCLFNTS